MTSVMKPTKAVTSASVPGMNRLEKLSRAAVIESAPSATAFEMALICCTPCETPMAKTRKGTRMASGSRPKPSKVRVPNCQTTDTIEQKIGRRVSSTERQYQ